MRLTPKGLELSASDLSNFLSCRQASDLDHQLSQGKVTKPEFNNPHADAIQKRGFEHEANYINHLKSLGLTVASATMNDPASTIKLMHEGVDVIVQGALELPGYFGRTDILRKVPTPSKLGDWSYEVVDTKLAKETKATSLLQLCLYSEMLAQVQGLMPEHMAIVPPSEDFTTEEYRVEDFAAYYRLVKNTLESSLKIEKSIYPEPRDHCDICKWFNSCDKRRRSDDHLSFVANLSSAQRKELALLSIETLETLGTHATAFENESLEKARHQARLQLEARRSQSPRYELLPLEVARGLNRLPEPSAGDIFFDLEGDQFYGNKGLEYLWGYAYLSDGELFYQEDWCQDTVEEKNAFVRFMNFVLERKKKYPDLKIYHYAPYEPTALKRLMGQTGMLEAELDQMLREEIFVDLYSITRQSIRAGIEKYSIKDLEQFYGYKRELPLRDVGPHKRFVEHSLELHHPLSDIPKEALEAVETYNKDDCYSTYYLREWLEERRREWEKSGETLSRPAPASGEIKEETNEHYKLMEELRLALQKDTDPNDPKFLVGNLIEFYNRENKAVYWEKFRLQELDPFELLHEKRALSGLTFIEEIPDKKIPILRFSFIPQEIDMKPGDDIYIEASQEDTKVQKFGELRSIDFDKLTIDIKSSGKTQNWRPGAVWAWKMIKTTQKEQEIIDFARFVQEHGLEAQSTKYKALRDIVRKINPDLTSPVTEESTLSRAKAMANNLNHSYLAIQGPPGAGKSYSASQIILDLTSRGFNIGVSATSHKVISNLLEAVLKNSKGSAQGRVFQKNDNGDHPDINYLKDKHQIESVLDSQKGVIIGGTDFAWAGIGDEKLDYLVVDEAGQFSLAGLIAISRCTKNLILLGDGAQLTQPLQGSHPEGADVSALDYIVDGAKTLPMEKGVFLEKTYRLHDDICKFISELYYDNKLTSIDGNAANLISGATRYKGLSLVLEEVEHSGCSNRSQEEVERIKDIIRDLTQPGSQFTVNEANGEKVTKQIEPQNIKIITPYNSQLNLLKRTFPQFDIGTVDKFQGQEAAVVIYSVATSSPEEAPRGMDFLYSGNRLNVAVSRAKCLFIMVASPKIFEIDCKSPGQMKLANGYARFREVSKK